MQSCYGTIKVELLGFTDQEADLGNPEKYVVRGEHVLRVRTNHWWTPPQTASIGTFVGRTASGAILFSISGKDANVFTFDQNEFDNAAYRVQLLQLQPDGTAICLAECESSPYYVIYARGKSWVYPADREDLMTGGARQKVTVARPKGATAEGPKCATTEGPKGATAEGPKGATVERPATTVERPATTVRTRSVRDPPQCDAVQYTPSQPSRGLLTAMRRYSETKSTGLQRQSEEGEATRAVIGPPDKTTSDAQMEVVISLRNTCTKLMRLLSEYEASSVHTSDQATA